MILTLIGAVNTRRETGDGIPEFRTSNYGDTMSTTWNAACASDAPHFRIINDTPHLVAATIALGDSAIMPAYDIYVEFISESTAGIDRIDFVDGGYAISANAWTFEFKDLASIPSNMDASGYPGNIASITLKGQAGFQNESDIIAVFNGVKNPAPGSYPNTSNTFGEIHCEYLGIGELYANASPAVEVGYDGTAGFNDSGINGTDGSPSGTPGLDGEPGIGGEPGGAGGDGEGAGIGQEGQGLNAEVTLINCIVEELHSYSSHGANGGFGGPGGDAHGGNGGNGGDGCFDEYMVAASAGGIGGNGGDGGMGGMGGYGGDGGAAKDSPLPITLTDTTINYLYRRAYGGLGGDGGNGGRGDGGDAGLAGISYNTAPVANGSPGNVGTTGEPGQNGAPGSTHVATINYAGTVVINNDDGD